MALLKKSRLECPFNFRIITKEIHTGIIQMKAFIAVLIFGAICLFAALKISEPQKSAEIDSGLSQIEAGASSEDSDELVFHKLDGGKQHEAEPKAKTTPSKVKCTTDTD